MMFPFAVRASLPLAIVVAFAAPRARAEERAAEPVGDAMARGGRVKWARLRIGDATQWDRHIVGDTFFLEFLRRNTSLDIDDEVYEAHADRLEDLSRSPFLFVESLLQATPEERHNVAEYIRRGGFVFLDACEDSRVNPDAAAYLRGQLKLLSAELPDLLVAAIGKDHAVYGNVFKMDAFPPTPRAGSLNPVTGEHLPLTELFLHGRSVGIISVGGLQCARAGHNGPLQAIAAMRMTTNVYVYALMGAPSGTAVVEQRPNTATPAR
jgi:hypothetical protein